MVDNREADKDVHGLSPGDLGYASDIQGDRKSQSRFKLIRDGLFFGGISAAIFAALAFGTAAITTNQTDERTKFILAEIEEHRYMTDCLVVRVVSGMNPDRALALCQREANDLKPGDNIEDALTRNLRERR